MNRTLTHLDTTNFPSTIKAYVEMATIYDSSSSPTAKTYFIQNKKHYFLKIEEKGKLLREFKMYHFLSQFKVAPKPVAFETDEHNDYLLTQALKGEDGIAPKYLNNPYELAHIFGKSLQYLHSLPIHNCPFPNRMEEIENEIWQKSTIGDGDTDIIPEGKPQALNKFKELKYLAQNEVIMHGDYCLPNIILKNFKLNGFIDLGYGGIGDRYYDIFWGIWTLNYNLKTHLYRDTFLEGYGKKDIDVNRLELCRLIAGLTG
jgi:kanamycin kinase